jgi:hypothetical protein
MRSVKILFLLVFGLLSSIHMVFAQSGTIKGTIRNALNNEPLPFVNVIIENTDQGTVTDDNGFYEITGLTAGIYNIRASFIGFREQVAFEIQVTYAKPAVLDFLLEEAAEQLVEVVVKADPFRKTEESPVSLRNIGVAEIQRNPGANRDISRVIQILPGVTAGLAFRNDILVRGGGPNENRFFLDEVEVPNINHFATQGASGGPVGLINVNFIKEVDFFTGAFPANRGNALSSVMNLRQRDGRDDRMGANFTLSATDVGLTLEGPINDKTTYLVSARRSYLELLFDVLGLPFLPTYNDFQLKIKHKPNEKSEFSIIGLGAIDQFNLNLDANETENQRFLLENLPVSPQWSYTLGAVYKRFDEKGYWTVVASRNMLNNESKKYFNNDDSSEENLLLDYQSREMENKFRLERTTRVKDYKFNFGVGYEYARYQVSTFNKIFTFSGAQTIDFTSNLDLHKYFGFWQASRNLMSDKLILSLGVRADGTSYSDNMRNPLEQLSPRFSLSYRLSEKLAFNFNSGIFYQLPPYTILGYRENGRLVNRENKIDYIANNQLVAGFEWNIGNSTKASIEGYLKTYRDYPFLLRDSITLANRGADFGVVGNEPAVPISRGRTYGLEFLIQQRLFKGFFGLISYTLGRSEFEDKDGVFQPSAWDSRHILNLSLGKRLKRDWEIGVNLRYQSGLPFTPFSENSALVQNWDVNGRGVKDFSQLNTIRLGSANTLDVRVDKKWYFKNWNLNLYFDVENILSNAVVVPELILDRPLDENNTPIGPGVIVNPDAPASLQRYRLKEISDAQGTFVPSIGLIIEL